MIRYEIIGGNLPAVLCHLQQGQSMCTERGAMSWMTPNMQMNTNTGGGIGKMFGRMLSNESAFMNKYTCTNGEGMIAFASSFPGSIIPFELDGGSIIVQKSGFLAMEEGMDLSIFFQKKLGAGFFGGEGFIMQKISGRGVAFVEIDGACVEYQLAPGESMILDTGYLAAMESTCTMSVETVKGVKNVLFGGEGLFNTKVTGPGKIYIQTIPISKTAAEIAPFIVTSKN